MTGAPTMTAFTPTAEVRLNGYLTQVRQALYANPDVSPDDVEADVREHIDTEFTGLNRPVTLGELDVVLARLGPPTQWAPTPSQVATPGVVTFNWKGFVGGVKGGIRNVFHTLWKGPEDWRLAYLTFGLTLLAPLTFGLSLIVAFFFGRAAVELVKSKGEPLGARRWLVYPPIVAVVFPLFLAILFGPGVAVGTAVGEAVFDAQYWEARNWERETRVLEKEPFGFVKPNAQTKWVTITAPIPLAERSEHERILQVVRVMPGSAFMMQAPLFVMFVVVGTFAAWWAVVGLLFWMFPKWPTTTLHPLLDGYGSAHGLRLAAGGWVALVVWMGLAYRLWDAARIG